MYLNEESCHTDAFTEPVTGVLYALNELKQEFPPSIIDQGILQEAIIKSTARVTLKRQRYAETV